MLRPELAAVIGAQRFLSEIRTTANLQHPHILPLFESGRVEVYLPSFPDPTLGRWKLSSNGAAEPVWPRGGRVVAARWSFGNATP